MGTFAATAAGRRVVNEAKQQAWVLQGSLVSCLMARDAEAGHWLHRWPELGQKGQGRLWRGHKVHRHREVVLTTFLEEEAEAQGGPKTLGSSLLVRVKPGP